MAFQILGQDISFPPRAAFVFLNYSKLPFSSGRAFLFPAYLKGRIDLISDFFSFLYISFP